MGTLYKISSDHIFPSDPTIGKLGSIDFNISLIQWFGIPLLGAKKESTRFKILIGIYGAVVMSLVTFIYTGFELHDLVLCWGNLNELTQNTCLSLTHVTGAVKVINVFYRRKDIMRMIEQFKVLTKKYVISEKQKETFFWGEFENKIPLLIYSSMAGFTGIMGMIMMMFNPTEIAGQIFPYRAKMPDFLPYTIQVIYMSLAVFIAAIQIVGVDYMNVTLINQTRYQLKILNIAFDRLALSDKACKANGTNKYFSSIVEHHNSIIEIRKEIESIFKYPILLQFLTSLMIFAMTGFQATVRSDSSGAVLIYFYCGCILCELFVYCWFGNEVSEQNKTLAFRGYNSSWFNFDQRYKKSLIIFLINAQRPFYFTAGGFVELSLVTFSGILSKSYTFIAVLRQIYADK